MRKALKTKSKCREFKKAELCLMTQASAASQTAVHNNAICIVYK